jgi:predicted permease
MSTIVARLDHLHPPMFQDAEAVLWPFAIYITGESRRTLLIFMGAVFLVLLIACANVASLVLARANRRALEIGVRAALGASRWRLIRQLLAESMILAGAGSTLGVAVAFLAIRLLPRMHPGNIPRLDETSINGYVLLFTIGLSLATAVLSGLLPALSASRCTLSEVLKSSGNRSVKGGQLRHGLVIGEVALTVVLLTGSGLLIRSFLRLQSVDKGFDPASRLTMGFRLDARYQSPARQNRFFRHLIERAGAMPGVEEAAAVSQVPLGGGESIVLLQVEGHPFDEKTMFEARSVTPRYFAAMGIPVLGGRDFNEGDVTGRPQVVIVSRSFSRRYFPGDGAVGKRLSFGRDGQYPMSIVGVVGDVRQRELGTMPPMQVYTALWQGGSPGASIVVRTHLPADRVASDMRAVVRGLDPAVAMADVRTMDQLVSGAAAERRFQTLLLTVFGGMALFLSLVGLYALVSYSVQQRTAEIGIRMALGAQRSSVMRLVLRQASNLAFAGVAVGVVGAWGLTRLMATLLFEVTATDPATFVGVAILFCAVALAACYIPARRATKVDPMVALRYE